MKKNLLAGLAFGALALGIVGTGVSRELPVGRVTGTVTLSHTKSGFANATIRLVPQVLGGYEEVPITTISARTDAQGSFNLSGVPEGLYAIECYGQAVSAERKSVRVFEAQTARADVLVKPIIPTADLYVSQHVFTPSESPTALLRGWSQLKMAKVGIYRVNLDGSIRGEDLRQMVSPLTSRLKSNEPVPAEAGTWVKDVEVPLDERDSEGIFHEDLKLDPLPDGVYLLSVKVGTDQLLGYVISTRIGAVVKAVNGKMLAFVSDLNLGTPVSGAQIQLGSAAGLSTVGTTGADGTVEFASPRAEEGSDQRVVIARAGTSSAFVSAYDYSSNATHRLYFRTDRPIYRPGDVAQFKGTLRKRAEDGYALPEGGTASVTVRDPMNNVLKTESLPVGAHGSFAGSFQMLEEVVGGYNVDIKYADQEFTQYVAVAAYRKPEFKMTVTPTDPFFLVSDSVEMKVDCRYFYGGPVPGAKLSGEVYRRPKWSDDFENFDSIGDYEDMWTWDGEYVGTVSGETDAQGIAILKFNPKDSEYGGDDLESYDATYTFQVSATETGDKYFTASGKAEVRRGLLQLRASTDRWLMKPGESVGVEYEVLDQDGKPAPANTPVEVVVGYERWQKRAATFEPTGKVSLKTGVDGTVRTALRADRVGTFSVRASVVDARGNTVRAERYVDVWQDGDQYDAGPDTDLSISLDQKTYLPGATVTALVKTRHAGGSALVTVERDKIYFSKVVPLTSSANGVTFKLPDNLIPNADVLVSYIHHKKLLTASKRVTVLRTPKQLKVLVKADRDKYKPGESATFKITTLDASGAPVAADVSLSVVDEAIYAVREDNSDPARELYPFEWNDVSTSDSLVQLYLDGGDKGDANVDIRTDFRDTAAWNPMVTTGADGTARVTVPLPDNLTAWRATATAITDSTLCGVGRGEAIVKKDLMVRLSPPGYLVAGDEVRFSIMVNNGLGEATNATVELVPGKLQVQGELRKSVTVPADKPVQLTWIATPSEPGDYEVTAIVRGSNGASDAMRLTLPVAAFGRESVTAKSGSVQTGSRVLKFDRAGVVTAGNLEIRIAPSLGADLLSGLNGLIDYPYGCVEQTMSRFMPAVVADRAARELGLPTAEWSERLPRITARSLNRLQTMQHSDGGWGWWESDSSDIGMTALVMEGLWRARAAGVAVPDSMLSSAMKFAQSLPIPARLEPADIGPRCQLAYARALFGQVGKDDAILAKAATEPLHRAYLLLADQMRGRNVTQGIDRLVASSRTAEGIRWWGAPSDGWGTSELETTTRILQLLTMAPDRRTEAEETLRYILAARQGSQWESTRATAQILVGLVQYLTTTRELQGGAVATVLLNGESVLGHTFGSGVESAQVVTIPVDKLKSGENKLEIVQSGDGVLYYSAELRQFARTKTLDAITGAEGFSVSRIFRSLHSERMASGQWAVVPSRDPVTSFKSGDTLQCNVKLQVPKGGLPYVMIRIPVPANFKAIEDPMLDEWSWWYSSMEVHDDHVVYFATRLYEGVQEFSFNLRAEAPGTATALPVDASPMYLPQIRASSQAVRIEVSE